MSNSNILTFIYSSVLISLVVGITLYYVFGIISLIQDYRVSQDCKSSHLWEYSLVNLLMGVIHVSINNLTIDSKEFDMNKIKYLYGLIFTLSMALWGGVELWVYSCNELNRTVLWKMGCVTCVINSVGSIILIIFPLILYRIISNLIGVNNDVCVPISPNKSKISTKV
jgi:predicted DNA repair protein MutK